MEVTREEFGEATRGLVGVPTGTEFGHVSGVHMSAMQYLGPDGKVVAQATYWRGSAPKYEVFKRA